jgi:4-amino-4-deoxy-L-arabinose transferase-like glycosyltransferase/thioredoxin-like negative regulator of GroEL
MRRTTTDHTETAPVTSGGRPHLLAGRAFRLIVGAALLVKLTVLWQLADHPMLHENSGLDTTAYAELARRVVNGDLLLGPGLYYLSPLYIYVLAFGLAVTDSFVGARALQAILGALSVGGIWYLTQLWTNTRAANWAAGLAIVTGVMTFYEVIILQASIDTALTVGALIPLALALRTDQPRWFIVTGVAFGLAALNRPNMTLVVLGLFALLLLSKRVKPAVLLLAGTALAFSPVAIRNGMVAGQWMTVSSHGGLNLYIGNSENATGFYRQVPGITPSIAGQAHDTRVVAGQALGREVTDAEASDYFVDQALTWMTSHPLDAAGLFAKKFAFVFHAKYVALPHSFPFYAGDTDSWLRYLPIGPWLLMPLGLVGLAVLVVGAEDRRRTAMWVAFVPLYAGAVAVFFVADRYRLPLLVPMCVGGGVALDALAVAIRERSWRAVAAPAVCGLVLLALVNAPYGLNEGRWSEGLKLAQRLVILGRDAEAQTWVDRLAPDADPRGMAHYLVGQQYLVEGKPELAIPLIEAALAQGLRMPRLLGDLANARERSGDEAGAIAALSQVEVITGEPADLWLQLGRSASTLRQLDLAGDFFAQAVQQTPDDADARLQYGVNLVLRNQIDQAAEQLRAAQRLSPRQPDVLAYLAYCAAATGDVDTARRLASDALVIDPAHQVAQSVLAAIR